MALGSTQPLVKMSTRNIPGGKGIRCVRLTTYHHIVPMSIKSRSLNFLDPSGPAWPVMGVLYLFQYILYNSALQNICIPASHHSSYEFSNRAHLIYSVFRHIFCLPAYLIFFSISAYLLHSRIPIQLMEWNLCQ